MTDTQEMKMTRLNLLRGAALSLALAAGLSAHAQGTNPNPTGPGNTGSQKAGEAYPNDPNAANPNKPRAAVVQRATNSRPAQATKRVTKKATTAVKNTGNRAANALRNTGESINRRVPPGPNDPKQ